MNKPDAQLMCKVHKKEIIFSCSCDSGYLCTACFDSGRHTNHQVDIINQEENQNLQGESKIPALKQDKNVIKNKVEVKKLQYLKGDLLTSDADIIVQQCNCITTNAKGLSQSILNKFGVSPYENRVKGKGNIADISSIDIPGTCTFEKPKIKHKNNQIQYIANMFCQFAPGKTAFKYSSLCSQVTDPLTGKDIRDNAEHREKWFQLCLQQLADFATENELYRVAFPFNIGCGLAGGKWENYKKYIEDFSKENNELQILIIQLE